MAWAHVALLGESGGGGLSGDSLLMRSRPLRHTIPGCQFLGLVLEVGVESTHRAAFNYIWFANF